MILDLNCDAVVMSTCYEPPSDSKDTRPGFDHNSSFHVIKSQKETHPVVVKETVGSTDLLGSAYCPHSHRVAVIALFHSNKVPRSFTRCVDHPCH
jgi:hypothetical protein